MTVFSTTILFVAYREAVYINIYILHVFNLLQFVYFAIKLKLTARVQNKHKEQLKC